MALAIRLLAGNAYAHEAITIGSTTGGTGFTNAVYGVKTVHLRAVTTVEGGIMRYTYDGTPPTSTLGHLLERGDVLIVEGRPNIAVFKAIRAGDQDGSLRVTYEEVHG